MWKMLLHVIKTTSRGLVWEFKFTTCINFISYKTSSHVYISRQLHKACFIIIFHKIPLLVTEDWRQILRRNLKTLEAAQVVKQAGQSAKLFNGYFFICLHLPLIIHSSNADKKVLFFHGNGLETWFSTSIRHAVIYVQVYPRPIISRQSEEAIMIP